MNKENVHLFATALWGIYGITVGSLGILYHTFSPYVMVSIVSAIAGNSGHLIFMSFNKAGISVSSEDPKKS